MTDLPYTRFDNSSACEGKMPSPPGRVTLLWGFRYAATAAKLGRQQAEGKVDE